MHLRWVPCLLPALLVFETIATLTSAYKIVSDTTLRSIPRPDADFNIHNGALLAPILQPRVPGTPGSQAVRGHFMAFFRDSLPDWKVRLQNSTSKTPVTGDKEVPFVNLIVSRDPPWTVSGDVSRLTLVAHYDSKYSPSGFIGATDSAAPCAMILHAVRSIDKALSRKWNSMKPNADIDMFMDEHQGIQILFLDGEEAFESWTDTDSLYGSRALAASMEEEVYPATSLYKSPLSAISLFVLLDLLGAKDPKIPSYSKTNHWAYVNMARLESRLRQLGAFKSSPGAVMTKSDEMGVRNSTWLTDASKSDNDEFYPFEPLDDQVPFIARGVPILHIIPIPFPKVWHTLQDDGEHLDMNTVEDWSVLITAFLAEWMDLEGYLNDARNLPDQPKTEL